MFYRLTNFVLKTLVAAQAYVHVDSFVIESATEWIFLQQQTNGIFVEPGVVYNTALQGGTGKGLALLAYVIISLMSSNSPIVEV